MFSSAPSPDHSSSKLPGGDSYSESADYFLDGVFDDIMEDDEFALAAEIDDFTDSFLPLKPTSSCQDAFKDADKSLSMKSLFSKVSAFYLDEKLFSSFKEELELLPTPSSAILPPTISAPVVSTLPSPSLKLSVPLIQPVIKTTNDETAMYFARPVAGAPNQFIASQVPPLAPRQIKRKRTNHIDEQCPTDGQLYKILIEGCDSSNKLGVPCSVQNLENQSISKANRVEAKRKLNLKKHLASQKKFSGHYPERKMVASSRKRVGGRFVKENKAVFRPAQTTVNV